MQVPISAATIPKRRVGLIANRSHQDDPLSALVQLLSGSQAAIAFLNIEFVVVGRTLDAIYKHGLDALCPTIERFPYGREGGLMKLVSRVVDEDPLRAVDSVIYLIDPVDPSSVFPEAVALKRQCVIHQKPFLSTLASAQEWLELQACLLGKAADPALNARFQLEQEGIALIAHDALKPAMLTLAEKHFAVLDRFACRYATGTTGGLLNQTASRLKATEAPAWVHPYRSGPLGGDAQLAELVLERKIRRILFLEDPHVARQHEADIQLLERAARTVTDFALVISEASEADRYLHALSLRSASA